MTTVFHEQFLGVDAERIAQAITSDGFFIMERALTDAWLAQLQADVAAHPFAINKNWVSGVYAESQYYLNQMMACSRAFFECATHPKVFEVCDRILGTDYRLKAMRYYETYGHHHMQWHTDNKTDRGFAHIPGLIFIIYVDNVSDGEFQYIRGSQHWSGDKAYSDYSASFIEKNHAQDVVSFRAAKGTVIIYDTYGIHRAKPVADKNFVRKSLFFQVDTRLDSAEPLLLNPSFFASQEPPEAKLCRYLGFGQASEYEVFPNTSLNSLPMKRVSLWLLMKWAGYRLVRSSYNLAPHALKNILRQLLGKTRV